MANGYGINLKIAVIYIFIGNIGGKTIGKTIGTSMEKNNGKSIVIPSKIVL